MRFDHSKIFQAISIPEWLRVSLIFRSMLTLAVLIITGCAVWKCWTEKDYSAGQKRNSHLIGMSYMTMNNEFYKIIREEINARVEAEGDRTVLRDPALNVKRQTEQIDDMLDMGIDVLILTPVDWEKLASVLKRAKQQGVWIVVVDTKVNDDDLVDCTITSDNYKAGVMVGRYFLKQCRRAKIIIMTHTAAKSGQDRVRGFLDTVRHKDDIDIVRQIECEGQLEIAMPKMQKAIQKGTVFDNVFCLNDLTSIGVVAALKEHHMLDKVDVYGVDASPDAKALIQDGMMKASAAQFPSKIGEKAADIVYQLLQGKQVDREVLVPVKLATEHNVKQFGINRWQ